MTAVRTANHRTRVVRFVSEHAPGALCARCIASAVGMRPSAVQRVATLLEGTPDYVREHAKCVLCRHIRLVVRRQHRTGLRA